MAQQSRNKKFTMTEPREYNKGTKYAFWLVTSDNRLFEFTESLICVNGIARSKDGLRALINIDNDYDADEAWHWIHTELEDESNMVDLDQMWLDAFSS